MPNESVHAYHVYDSQMSPRPPSRTNTPTTATSHIKYKPHPSQAREMNKTTKPKMIRLSLLLIPLLLLLPAAHASTISTGGGTFQPTGPPTIVSSHQFNGFLILRETFGLQFTGPFTGATTGTVIIIINLATGNGAFFGQNDFTGTVTTSAGPASGTILSPF